MFKFETSVLNSEGQPIVGASVSIFATGTSTLAQLYEDDQITLKTNPLTSDSTGLVQCKAVNGKYDYLVSNLPGGGTRRINGVIFDDPTEAGSASIALSMPGEFAVTGSPGQNIGVTKKSQVANSFFAGPTTGVAAPPTMRAIVSEDLPFGIATRTQRGIGFVPNSATFLFTDVAANSSTTPVLVKNFSFTPTLATSKLLVTYHLHVGGSTAGASQDVRLYLNGSQVGKSGSLYVGATSNYYQRHSHAVEITPSGATAQTIGIYLAGGGGTAYINRTGSDDNTGGSFNSAITIQELFA